MKETSEAATRVRNRLADEMRERSVSQRELAELLSGLDNEPWTQSKVGKVLTGRVALKVHDADLMARALGITLTEAVRDRGLEFYAELTPSEVRLFERLRHRPQMLEGVMLLLRGAGISDRPESNKKRGRPLNSQKEKNA